MKLGMLWRVDRKDQPLADAVREAATYYADKYGQPVTVCYVHPSTLLPDGAPVTVGTIRVRPLRTVQAGHLWLGVEAAH